MRGNTISINWTGAKLTGPQQFIIRRLAVLFLRTRGERDFIDFTHELVEGRMYLKSRGSFGTFAGTFFHVDLGMVKDERWTVDFLIPAGKENIIFQEGDQITNYLEMPDGSIRVTTFDPMEYKATEDSLLG